MIKSLLSWFKEAPVNTASHSPNRAAAVLMMEVIMADDTFSVEEQLALPTLLSTISKLTHLECAELIEIAKQEHADASSIQQFTSHINDEFSIEKKLELLTCLWQIALADNNIDKYEEHIIRRIADLLHLRHSEFIKCKHDALSLAK